MSLSVCLSVCLAGWLSFCLYACMPKETVPFFLAKRIRSVGIFLQTLTVSVYLPFGTSQNFLSLRQANLLSPSGSSLFDTILYDKSLRQLDLCRKKRGSPSGIALSRIHSETLRDLVTMDHRHLSRERNTLQSPHLCKSEPDCFPFFSQVHSLWCIFNWIKNDLPC